METTTRNADLTTLRDMLLHQQARKVDFIVPASKIRSEEGVLVVTGAEPILDEDGVTPADGRYLPTSVCDEGVASKLGIHLSYLRRLRKERVDLYDANVNGWLHGRKAKVRYSDQATEVLREGIPGDQRNFMLRAFRGDEGVGVARALLSDRYRAIDNLDVLVAVLSGVQEAGAAIDIVGADLTDSRMYVRIKAPSVSVLAPDLLRGYRNPFEGRTGVHGEGDGTVFAGFVVSNSEVGDGAFSITPRLIVQVCSNGLTVTKDAMREVHLGGKQEESVIQWSDDTNEKSLAVITAKARDAVATFLDVDYMRRVINDLESKSDTTLSKPAEDVRTVAKKLAFSEETTNGVFDAFIRGGQTTAGGVMQAITAYAGQVEDADLAASLEDSALKALDLAAALR